MVAHSSAEVEYRSTAHGVYVLLWPKLLLIESVFPVKGLKNLYYDNKAPISTVHNPVQHNRTKHIEVDQHFIKEKLMS